MTGDVLVQMSGYRSKFTLNLTSPTRRFMSHMQQPSVICEMGYICRFGDQLPGERHMLRYKYVLVGAAVLVFTILSTNLLMSPEPGRVYQVLTYSAFLDRIEENEVRQVLIRGDELTGFLKDGTSFSTHITRVEKTVDLLLAQEVVVDVEPPGEELTFLSVLIAWLPIILLFGSLWFFVSRPLMRIERRLQHLEQAVARQQTANGD